VLGLNNPHLSQSPKIINSLSDLVARIKIEHEAATDALKRSVAHAIAAGDLFLKAKKQFKHGGWLPWLNANCDIPERTVQAYMRLARLPIEKRNAVADLHCGKRCRQFAAGNKGSPTPRQ
jgi:hypothetical protein